MNALTMFVKSLDAATGFHLNAEQRVLKKLTQLAPLADEQLRLRDQRFVVLDTETTGLRPGKGDRVTSLGAVVVENGMVNESKTFYELVDPGRNIPEEISQLTGITNDMVAGKPNLTEVLNRFLPWAGKSVLAGM